MRANEANTTLFEPSSSIYPHVVLYVSQLVALIVPPSRGRKIFFSTLIIVLAVYVHLNPHFTNDVTVAQPFTIAWSFYMATLTKLLFSPDAGPETSYWRVHGKRQEALHYQALSWAKLQWSLKLICNQRGIRWNFEVKNVPKVLNRKRTSFLLDRAYQFCTCLVVADFLLELSTRLYFTSEDGTVGNMNSKNLTLRHRSWKWDFVRCLVFGATPYFMLSMQYAQFAFLGVLLGLSNPEDWPSPFGRLADTTTIRDFWGKFWHQQLRHMLTLYTNAFADFARIRRGTNLSSYTKLYLAFVISGMFHALSQLQMPCPINITSWERCWGFFLFFVWQMVAITFEDFIQWVYKGMGGNFESTKGSIFRTLVGYLWVIGSMWASIPLVGDTFLRMRMGVDSLLPMSIAKSYVIRYVPVPA